MFSNAKSEYLNSQIIFRQIVNLNLKNIFKNLTSKVENVLIKVFKTFSNFCL